MRPPRPPLTRPSFLTQTRFYAAGRLLSGPDRLSFYIALTCTLLPLSTFWSAVLPWLIEHYPRWAIPLQVVSVYAILFALVNLFITAFMDPGILPRRPDPSHGNPLSKKKPPSTQKVSVNGVKQRVKYCDTCNLYRPPRATHCSICDNCVDRFDHHCPWVGNCVGRRNYRFFLLFVLAVSFNCVRRSSFLSRHTPPHHSHHHHQIFATSVSVVDFALAATTSDAKGGGARFVAGLRRSPLALPVALFSAIVFGFVTGLGGYHLYLLATAQTTNENVRTSDARPFFLR